MPPSKPPFPLGPLILDVNIQRPIGIPAASPAGRELVAPVPLHLAAFLRLLPDGAHAHIPLPLLLGHFLPQLASRIRLPRRLRLLLLRGIVVHVLLRGGAVKAGADPIVQIPYVGDDVDAAAGAHDVGVLGHQGGRDNAGLALAGLEVRVREAEEEAGEGGAREEVGQELHRVGAQRGDVLIRGRLLGSEGEDARVGEVVHLVADLQACV